jgi:hypothetical protein
VQAALQRNAIDFTSDGSVRGGYVKASRKHKKNGKNGKNGKMSTTRKQKGGFAWGKYRKTATNAAATPIAKNTSSLTHSRKKYKINSRARGVTKRHK